MRRRLASLAIGSAMVLLASLAARRPTVVATPAYSGVVAADYGLPLTDETMQHWNVTTPGASYSVSATGLVIALDGGSSDQRAWSMYSRHLLPRVPLAITLQTQIDASNADLCIHVALQADAPTAPTFAATWCTSGASKKHAMDVLGVVAGGDAQTPTMQQSPPLPPATRAHLRLHIDPMAGTLTATVDERYLRQDFAGVHVGDAYRLVVGVALVQFMGTPPGPEHHAVVRLQALQHNLPHMYFSAHLPPAVMLQNSNGAHLYVLDPAAPWLLAEASRLVLRSGPVPLPEYPSLAAGLLATPQGPRAALSPLERRALMAALPREYSLHAYFPQAFIRGRRQQGYVATATAQTLLGPQR